MSLNAQFATNSQKEIEGVEIQYGPNEDGTIPTFVISRMGKSNKKYTKALEAATRPYRRQIELGTMSNEVAQKLFVGVFVETVLKGWQHVKKADVTGDAKDTGYADFSKENATALFARLPELYDDLTDKAGNASLFREETLEEEAKN